MIDDTVYREMTSRSCALVGGPPRYLYARSSVRALTPHSGCTNDGELKYGSDAWKRFCKSSSLEPSMRRKGNSWANTVAKSLFRTLNNQQIKKHIYKIVTSSQPTSPNLDSFYNRH